MKVLLVLLAIISISLAAVAVYPIKTGQQLILDLGPYIVTWRRVRNGGSEEHLKYCGPTEKNVACAQFNGKPAKPESEAHVFANGTLIINNIKSSDAGDYFSNDEPEHAGEDYAFTQYRSSRWFRKIFDSLGPINYDYVKACFYLMNYCHNFIDVYSFAKIRPALVDENGLLTLRNVTQDVAGLYCGDLWEESWDEFGDQIKINLTVIGGKKYPRGPAPQFYNKRKTTLFCPINSKAMLFQFVVLPKADFHFDLLL